MERIQRIQRRLKKLEDKVYLLTKAFQDVIVQSSLRQDEGTELVEELNHLLQVRNEEVYQAYLSFCQKLSIIDSSSDETDEESTDEEPKPMKAIEDFESESDYSDDELTILPPKPNPVPEVNIPRAPSLHEIKPLPEPEEDTQEVDKILEPKNPIRKTIIGKYRATPFKAYRKELEKFEKGTYFRIWKKWHSILSTFNVHILKETNPTKSKFIQDQVINRITINVQTFKQFVANVIVAYGCYIHIYNEIFEDCPAVRKEINKVQFHFTELEKLLRVIHIPENKVFISEEEEEEEDN